MCICINCLYVHQCSTYQYIEKQHGKKSTKKKELFSPKNPIIHVNIYNDRDTRQMDWDIVECLSFIDEPGSWKVEYRHN
uniref:Ycf34 n=1 Tax=Scinaia undulata TaxID=1884664 RepID=A0A1G4NXH5_9FLOR|nr:Hypothetical protein ycf34 [Scinaia undulata]SCW23362.1 Hypothetical protein ycf34 [Scinaia undulata]